LTIIITKTKKQVNVTYNSLVGSDGGTRASLVWEKTHVPRTWQSYNYMYNLPTYTLHGDRTFWRRMA